MPTNKPKPTDREIAFAMLAQLEHQAGTLVSGYGDGSGMSDRFVDFHALMGQLEYFQLFAELTESRLEDLDGSYETQLHSLLKARWRIMQLELDANRSFLAAMATSGRPWALGSKSILQRRLTRLDDIVAFHTTHGARCGLAAPDTAMLDSLRSQIRQGVGRSLALHDFRLELVQSARAPEPMARASTRPAAKPVAKGSAPRVGRLDVRQDDNGVYIGADGLTVVTDACRRANISLDDLAEKMEVSRPSLVLILNGRDPVNLGMLTHLRKFVGHQDQGGSLAA